MTVMFRLDLDNVLNLSRGCVDFFDTCSTGLSMFHVKNVLKHQKGDLPIIILPRVPKIYDTRLRLR